MQSRVCAVIKKMPAAILKADFSHIGKQQRGAEKGDGKLKAVILDVSNSLIKFNCLECTISSCDIGLPFGC